MRDAARALVPRGLELLFGRRTEQTTVLVVELRSAVVANLNAGLRRAHVFIEYQTSCFV